MKLISVILITSLLFSCNNYSIEYDYTQGTERKKDYSTNDFLSEKGVYSYGDVILENTTKNQVLEYSIERLETVYKEAFVEYSRPFNYFDFDEGFYKNIQPFSKVIKKSDFFIKKIRPGEKKSIGVKYRIEVFDEGLYSNNNPMGDRNDPRYSSYDYLEKSKTGSEKYELLKLNPDTKYYKKIKYVMYSYNIKGAVSK